MVVLAVVSAAGLVLDDRVLVGAPIWMKPFKFSVSFVAYCLSLAWLLAQIPPGRARRVGRWAGTVVVLGGAVEMVVIVGQVIRGRRSHFNHATPLDDALYNVMALTVVVLWLATLLVAVLLLRARVADRVAAWAMRSGIVLALAGAAVGFLMTQPAPGQVREVSDVVGAHSVGVPDGGPSMPLTGWSTIGGDLRIPHFFGMHALQVLPLVVIALAVLARRLPHRPELGEKRVQLRLIVLASVAYAAFFALLIWQALRGQPLLRPDAATLTAAGLIVGVTAAGTWTILRVARGTRHQASASAEAIAIAAAEPTNSNSRTGTSTSTTPANTPEQTAR
ncbi:hypothetical protein [Streptomyces boluensis]|uniref:hypothetical protein n=1 Tax=Streptomyces boluensis TaxID=1775135 RepID=UPI001FE786C1|nr:hypothetical protein [Streptomyces boluensis]